MSLVEDIARRQQSPVELLGEISNLKARGYSTTEIAKKIDLAQSYVIGISHLLEHGEERELSAGVRKSEAVALCHPIMPVGDGFGGRGVRINSRQL